MSGTTDSDVSQNTFVPEAGALDVEHKTRPHLPSFFAVHAIEVIDDECSCHVHHTVQT